jgi:hypothetical protein
MINDNIDRLGDDFWTEDPAEPIEWAERCVRFPKSARGERFQSSITPWIREPLYRACVGIWTPSAQWVEENRTLYPDILTVSKLNTLVKPVQSGGSAFGEVFLLYCLKYGRGFLQYNWPKDDRAKERWDSRIEATINACTDIATLLANLEHNNSTSMEIDLVRLFFRMQGVWVPDNLDSDSIAIQINEEIHSWKPGHLAKARARSTAVWNFKAVDISNAGKKGDQLAKAFDEGTRQQWEVRCPGCGKFHVMRTRWDKKNPKLGGLRYDGDKARRTGGGRYDYNVIRSTIRYQMPCEYVIHNDVTERKALSASGKYSKPESGSDLEKRSYTYEAVTVDYIDWVMLVQEKHAALKALSLGDPEPWRRYRTERECIPYDANDNPFDGGYVVLNTEMKKNREGLPDPKIRFGNLDRQQGNRAENEFPHWWLLLRDVQLWTDPKDGITRLRTRLVYEGKVETDEEVIRILDEHKVVRHHVVADSGDDTTHVYLFCLKYGINAIKGGKSGDFYVHPNGARRVYSPERPLHKMLNREPKFPYMKPDKKNEPGVPDPREPLFWLYSKVGIRERFHWLRTSTVFETPGDVSEDYQSHLDSEERVIMQHPVTGEEVARWIQKRKRNDQFVNECYCAMQIDQAGLILQEITKEGIMDEDTGTTKRSKEDDSRESESVGDNGFRRDSDADGSTV